MTYVLHIFSSETLMKSWRGNFMISFYALFAIAKHRYLPALSVISRSDVKITNTLCNNFYDI